MLEDVLKEWGAEEVDDVTLYSDIFQLGSGQIQKADTEARNMKSNPIGYWKNNDKVKGNYRIFFDDTFFDTLKELQDADFAIINGITYFGRKNLQANAHRMFALIFDIDGITDETLNNFMSGAIKAQVYPVPNYVILSGHGVHLYYVFHKPLPLYPNIKIQLKNLKYGLTEKMWNPYTSIDEKKQHQSINQGFRPCGARSKIDGVRVRAFALDKEKYTIDQLNEYVLPEYRVDMERIYKESTMTLDQAKVKYPEWYQKRVIEGDRSKGHWTCRRDLYDWWKEQIRTGATFHHRYFCCMILAIYAVKCGIDEEELKRDAYGFVSFLNAIAPSDPFTESDVESALDAFDERFVRFPIDDISRLSGITIQKNKRNGRKRADHVKLMNFVRDEINQNTTWREGSGRKSKESIVIEWRKNHPNGKKADCIRDTGLSKPTVYKHWK